VVRKSEIALWLFFVAWRELNTYQPGLFSVLAGVVLCQVGVPVDAG